MTEMTVPVSQEIEARLSRIAERTGQEIPEVLQAAVEAYEARLFFSDMDEAYAVLETDFKQWGEYMAGLSAWLAPDESNAAAPAHVAPEPDTVEPAATEPTAVEPATVEPATVERATVEPATVEPPAAESGEPGAESPVPGVVGAEPEASESQQREP